jgi:hypothetical protein
MRVPDTEFGPDPHTIALVNFDDDPEGLVRVEQGFDSQFPPVAYAVVERSRAADGSGVQFNGGVYVHDLSFEGGLWCWYCTFGSRFDSLLFQNGYMGLVLAGNSNEDEVSNLYVRKGGPPMRYGLLMATANGNRVTGAQIDDAVFPLVIQTAARVWLSDLMITPQAFTNYGALFFTSAPSIRGLYFDEENATPRDWVASLVESRNWAPSEISGLEVDGYDSGPAIIIDDGYGASITAASFGGSRQTPPVYLNGNGDGLKSPVVFNNSRTEAPALSNVPAKTRDLGSRCCGYMEEAPGKSLACQDKPIRCTP